MVVQAGSCLQHDFCALLGVLDGMVVLSSSVGFSWRDKGNASLLAKAQSRKDGPAAGAEAVITAQFGQAICSNISAYRGAVVSVCPAGLLEFPAALYEKPSSEEPGNTGKGGFPVNLMS